MLNLFNIHVLMKKILLFMLCILSFALQAQQTWQVELPFELTFPLGDIKDLTKASDGGFITLVETGDSPTSTYFPNLAISKITASGNHVWSKEYDFNISMPTNQIAGPKGQAVVGLSNGDIVVVGTIYENETTNGFFFKMNENGDSLLYKKYDTYGGFSLLDNDENVIILRTFSNGTKIIKLDESGEVISEVSLDTEASRITLDDEDRFYTSYNDFGTVTYEVFSSNGDSITEKSMNGAAQILAKSLDGAVVSFSKYSFLSLDENLETIWEVPTESFEITSSGLQDFHALKATMDNGYILGGTTGSFSDELSFLIKLEQEGELDWRYAYSLSALPINAIYDIEEVSDGYVCLGGNKYTDRGWLIKILENGFISSSYTPDQAFDITIFPNPFAEHIKLSIPDHFEGEVHIFDANGRELLHQVVNTDLTINLVHLPCGVYFLQVNNLKKQTITTKKIIKH